ncbi:MAG TPA: hypothetical protein VFD35_07855 [Pricia sp.]|nr:hypothetical protein [Pricia sp.]
MYWSHETWEARMLTEAAKKFKVVTQMGNQGGSGNGVRKMKEIYDAFKGKFETADYPKSFANSSMINLKYPRTDGKGSIDVTWMDGGLRPSRPDELGDDNAFGNWDGGVLFIGTNGKLLADCYGAEPRLLPLSLNEQISVKETIPRVPEGHYLQWVNACMAGYGNAETSSSFDYAGPFTESILIGNLALKSYFEVDPNAENKNFWGGGAQFLGRKRLQWDADNMKITNFEPANKYVKRTYRDGYSVG